MLLQFDNYLIASKMATASLDCILRKDAPILNEIAQNYLLCREHGDTIYEKKS